MTISAKIILDSINPYNDKRLITMELTYPRMIHSEFMTHRMFSRNAASSRAIPTKKMIKMVEEQPAIPVYWGKNKSGMAAEKELTHEEIEQAKELWFKARDSAVSVAREMQKLKLHKQILNRILEPWKLITVICTATEWANFFYLRCHKDAQPEIHCLANLMKEAQENSEPVARIWHIPYIQNDENNLDLETRKKIGIARCARVSYLTHDGKRSIDKDLDLYNRLIEHHHNSPLEHVAKATKDINYQSGNFFGWEQYRKTIPNENVQ